MLSFALEGAGRIEMDVPRGRLEIGDYVGGQLCKAVMSNCLRLPCTAVAPPRNSRETLFYAVIQGLFLAGCSGRVAPKRHAADFSYGQLNKQRVCELHRTGCV